MDTLGPGNGERRAFARPILTPFTGRDGQGCKDSSRAASSGSSKGARIAASW